MGGMKRPKQQNNGTEREKGWEEVEFSLELIQHVHTVSIFVASTSVRWLPPVYFSSTGEKR